VKQPKPASQDGAPDGGIATPSFTLDLGTDAGSNAESTSP
jgi:hypothetical protein